MLLCAKAHGEADRTLHHRGTARRDSDCGLHAEFGGKGRSELLCDNLVFVSRRVGALYVGVINIDSEIIRCNLRQSDIASKVR